MGSFIEDESSNDGYEQHSFPAEIGRDHSQGQPAQLAGAKDERVESRMAALLQTIEQEIIPRLVLAHRDPQACLPYPALEGQGIGPEDVLAFTKLALTADERAAFQCIESIRARGISLESIYIDLLAPVARHLGELWNQDLCDFTDVTLGLGRLQRILREISASAQLPELPAADGHRILLLPGPGQQHTFGLSMVREFFRRAGWNISGGATDSHVDPARLTKREHFDVVGLSFGDETKLGALGKCISNIRAESMNRAVVIIVGGPLFVAQPSYCELVQADAIITEGRDAPAMAQDLVSRFRKSSQRQA